LIIVLCERGPACAGRASPKAEPGADAGPAAPQAPPWLQHLWPDSAVLASFA